MLQTSNNINKVSNFASTGSCGLNRMDKAFIPVCSPKLPTASQIYPYIKKIDDNRYYSNFGPLVRTLEDRISEHLNYSYNIAGTASSGTLALEIALRTFNKKPYSKILCPSWTFIGTAQAIVNAHLTPVFSDVDIHNWWLDISKVREILVKNEDISGIILVAPFGNIPKLEEWESLSAEFNIDIIMDAASASLDSLTISKIIPIMVSLHATKLLTAGEGGVVLLDDEAFIDTFKTKINFGISNNGIHTIGTNAKLSEYHAALCHASLDNWEKTAKTFERNCKRYASNLAALSAISLLPGYGHTRFTNTCVLRSKLKLEDELNRQNIETRRWWRFGCHKEPLFLEDDINFPNTCKLAKESIALPNFVDIGADKIDLISEKIIQFNENGHLESTR